MKAKSKITFFSDSNDLRIFIDGITYVHLKKKNYLGFQSWLGGDRKGLYYIEIYLGTYYMTLTLEDPLFWKQVIAILDKTL